MQATVSLDVYSRGAKGDMTQKKKWWKAVAMAGRDLYGKRFNERTKTWMFRWCHKSSICWWTCDRTDREMDISIVKRCCEGCGSVMLKGKHPGRLTAGTYKSHLSTMDRVQSSNIILWKSICMTPTTGLKRLFLFQRDTPGGCGRAGWDSQEDFEEHKSLKHTLMIQANNFESQGLCFVFPSYICREINDSSLDFSG